MKIASVLILVSCMHVSATVYSQNVSISLRNKPVEKVLKEVEKQTGLSFMWSEQLLAGTQPVSVEARNVPYTDVLTSCLEPLGLGWTVVDNVVVIRRLTQAPVPPMDVRGTVRDENTKPLEGISVSIRGQARGAVTDAEGRFAIRAEKGQLLMFSGVGYLPAMIVVNDDKPLSITMKQQAIAINTVDVVMSTGYQELKKKNTASAFSIVDSKELDRKVNIDLMSALEGRVPGMSTFKNSMVIRGSSTFSGSVGNRPLIVIDGLPTETSSLSTTDLSTSFERSNLSSFINPNDVESVTVLKDAAAASIYGARAANGVIVITTKSGKGLGSKGKPSIKFSSDFIFTRKPDIGDMHYASTSDLIDYEMALYKRATSLYPGGESDLWGGNVGMGYIGSVPAISYYSPLYDLYRRKYEGAISQKEFDDQVQHMRGLDYRKEYSKLAWRNPFRQSYNLSVATSNEKQDLYISLNYIGQREKLISDNNETFNAYIKARQQLIKNVNLTVGVNTQYYRSILTEDNDYSNPASFIEPYSSILDGNGNRVYRGWVARSDGFSGFPANGGAQLNGKVAEQIDAINALKGNRLKSPNFNILDELERNFTRGSRLSVRSFANLDVQFAQGLNYSSALQFETSRNKTETLIEQNAYQMRHLVNRMATTTGDPFTSPVPFTYAIPEIGGRLQQNFNENWNYTWRNQLNLNRYFGRDHYISAIAGTEIRQNYAPRMIENIYYGFNTATLAFKDIDEYTLRNVGLRPYIWNRTTQLQRIGGSPLLSAVRHRFFSLYSNASYTYKDKYILGGSARIDQADLFGVDKKYRYRPLWSVSAGWDISKEGFMEEMNWADMLKLRASYGITGNVDQTSSPYVVASGGTNGAYDPLLDYYAVFTAPNPLLRWERTTTINGGVDYVLFRGKLRGALDVYHKKSDDLLATKNLDPTNGYATARINNGAMTNTGVEVSAGSDWYSNKQLTLTSMLTFAYNKNKVKRIDAYPRNAEQLVSGGYYLIGNPKDAMYAYQYAGISSGGTVDQNGIPLFYTAADKSTVNVVNNGSGVTIGRVDDVDALRYMGSSVPVWNASFQQSARYKGFDLNLLFVAYGGYKIRMESMPMYSSSIGGGAISELIARRWTPENQNTGYPKTIADFPTAQGSSVLNLNNYLRNADHLVKNANYIRLRNVTLGYTIPAALSRKAKLQQVKVSAQANNTWYWFSAGNDIDPDTYGGTSGTRSYQTPASYILRMDITL
ncbi:SusC/RagA family TonB-linked outer membrane protein [Chitinophaga sp. NPDC101104]|uniref:SusC/RagA family TonB-linked outer membrane protein n=1 Tax=Chitinophaga sp. NPDC101104 TaxID=3390561 RepID=UPI003D067AD9